MGKIKLTFLGDILCDPSLCINKYKNNSGYYFDPIFIKLKEVLKNSDYVFANLETPIAYDNKNLTDKRFEFNTPFEFARAIKNFGVDYVSTANNHCLDRGINGLIYSMV